jgi:hypothetical protein
MVRRPALMSIYCKLSVFLWNQEQCQEDICKTARLALVCE